MAHSTPSRPYLPHLNGLRALAVAGVLLYHLSAPCCPAGYFGVDVFLLLSGFLLWRSLLEPERAASFRYGDYLFSKAQRLLPTWFVVTTLTGLCSALLLYPAQMADTMKTAAASALALADYAIDLSGDYFNPLSQQNPLLHLWYLSLTLQFFIIAPLLLLPLRFGGTRRTSLLLLALLALLSLSFYLLTATPSPTSELLLRGIGARSAYYHLIPRFWELATGAFIFLLPALPTRPLLRGVLGMLGLVGIPTSFYLYATGSTAVYTTITSTLLVIRYADSGAAFRLLTLKPVQALGSISFALYLWHWPLMVFWKFCRFDTPCLWDQLGMLALSLVLATLSHRFIERRRAPAHAGMMRFAHRCILLISLASIFCGALLLQHRAQKFAGQSPLRTTALLRHPVAETDGDLLCGLESLPGHGLVGRPLRVGSAGAAPTFLLMGDSHAQHLYDALHEACLHSGLRGLYLNNTVSPYHGLIQPQVGADTCRWNADIEETLLAWLEAHPNITHVLIAQCWQMRMTEGPALEARSGKRLTSQQARSSVTAPGIGLFCDRLRKRGCVPVLLGETPRFPHPCPLEEWHRRELLGVGQRERLMSCEEFERRHAFPLATLRQLAQEQRAELIELTPALRVGDAYPARHEGEFWYYDANHLTPVAARRVATLILHALRQELPKASPH